MKCEVCNETELEGELALFAASASSDSLIEEVTIQSLMETARRNHIICDSCNKAVCHHCCTHPKCGFCDRCIERFNLHDLTRDIEEAG